MIPELGHFSLIIALALAITQGVLPIWGATQGNRVLMGLARPVAVGQFLFVGLAFASLAYSFVTSDFSVQYVAENSNSHLPVYYRFAALWGGHEGSILLWTMLLATWTLAVAQFSKHLPQDMVARVLGVMGLISVGFLTFMLLVSDPFQRLLPAPADGRDLNPLLQDPGMVIHPPMLYMGYVGFSVAFSFALSALIGGQLDATWARWSRPWTTVAWVFLTLGIALGSGWAYYEMGWGGWWFWDPVENASFMPWLAGTALIHSLAVTEKRGAFKSWTVLLAIGAFSLSLLGTFLVRSGVLTSVHAFVTDPRRGLFILVFLLVVIGLSLVLYAWRAPKVGLGGSFDLVSRESFLLSNNVLLSAAAATVLLGTLYPLIYQAWTHGARKLSVGPPYFDAVFIPLMVPMIILLGMGPIARWKQISVGEIMRRVRWPAAISIALGVLAPFAMGKWTPMIALGLTLAFWIMTTVVVDLRRRMVRDGKVKGQSRSYYGMQLAHFGVAVFILGVTLVKGYETERDVRMNPEDTVAVAGYTFRFDGVRQVRGPNYTAQQGRLVVLKGDKTVAQLYPEKRDFDSSPMPMTEAAINSGLFRDLYVSLGDPIGDGTGAWAVRVYYKPFVDWIWGGCVLMALGGILALSDRRYRIHIRKKQAGMESPAGNAVPAGDSPALVHRSKAA
ncbi:MAG TPA: heme lyase CcmF/NrfE family subunit [Gallionellaceae bacterium]|nr:heme lyase CcmF/NrfE family subunit [Gallionellaceae bacterium]